MLSTTSGAGSCPERRATAARAAWVRTHRECGSISAWSGGPGAGRHCGQDAELIAHRIGDRDPAAAVRPPVIGQLPRPEREEPLGLLLSTAVGRPEVQVDP